jgi:hypothetical protein
MAPQLPQNLAPSSFSAWHCGHIIILLLTCDWVGQQKRHRNGGHTRTPAR